MSKLKELTEKHGMGNGQRYIYKDWDKKTIWFEPIFINRDGLVAVGHLWNGSHGYYWLSEEGWGPYQANGLRSGEKLRIYLKRRIK